MQQTARVEFLTSVGRNYAQGRPHLSVAGVICASRTNTAPLTGTNRCFAPASDGVRTMHSLQVAPTHRPPHNAVALSIPERSSVNVAGCKKAETRQTKWRVNTPRQHCLRRRRQSRRHYSRTPEADVRLTTTDRPSPPMNAPCRSGRSLRIYIFIQKDAPKGDFVSYPRCHVRPFLLQHNRQLFV